MSDIDTGLRDSLRACLLGGALGDALGADIEFLSLHEICRRRPHGFMEQLVHGDLRAAITDDTQMTLFTLEGVIRALVRSASKGICHGPSVIHHALLRWLVTQGGRPLDHMDTTTGLVSDRRLHVRRSPGLTCLGALQAARHFGATARNNSKGCGALMRVAPLAFCDFNDIRTLAIDCSALTHGHPTGQDAAAAWALILADLVRGDTIEEAARRQINAFGDETRDALQRALAACRDGAPETIESLGAGWVAEEALAIALYACLCARDLMHGLTIAVTHSGDSDSTGAIAGNALGLMFREETLTHPWVDQLECTDLIARLSDDFVQAVQGDPCDLWLQYPGW